MNKKQKILTMVALAVFSVIVALHYGSIYFGDFPHTSPQAWPYQTSDRVWHVKHWHLAHHLGKTRYSRVSGN